MNEQMIIWFTIAGLAVVAFVFWFINHFRQEAGVKNRFLEMGSENDIFGSPEDKKVNWNDFERL